MGRKYLQKAPYVAMTSETSKHILAAVETKRELFGMSKAELARRMGIDSVTMGTMLRGQRSMYADEAMCLCACLDIDPMDLVSPEVRQQHERYWGKTKRK